MSDTKEKRASVAKKSYAEDGSAATFTFANGHVLTVALADIPAAIQARLVLHGLGQKVGDAYAGVKGIVDDAIENAEAIVEMLKNGEWTERAEGVGPRPSMVADAIVAALVKQGETVNETRAATIREKVKDKATREGALKNPLIKAVYEQMRLEKAAERVREAEKAAANAPTGNLGGF
jgi:hypothetical protein